MTNTHYPSKTSCAHAGSCREAGYTECCTDIICAGQPVADCYCDAGCRTFGDCCDDIDETCPSGFSSNGGFYSNLNQK